MLNKVYVCIYITKRLRDSQNMFAITWFRYIEVIFHIFYYYWGNKNVRWGKDLKTTIQKSMNNPWSYFQHFGRLLGKMYVFLTPYNLQPDLLESFPADVCPPPPRDGQFRRGHRAKFSRSGGGGALIGNWVWPKGEIHNFSVAETGWRGKKERDFWQIAHSSYSRH